MLAKTTRLLDDHSTISVLDVSSMKLTQDDKVSLIEESSIEELSQLLKRDFAPKIKEILFREHSVRNLFLTSPLVISRINPAHPKSPERSNLIYTIPHSDLETYEVSY